MGKISTHVLDTLNGKPAQGVHLSLYRIEGDRILLLAQTSTNADGRCDAPLLEGDDMVAGLYELRFALGDYYAALGVPLPEPRFLNEVVLRFGVAHPDQNYHVPLVATPWAYSTYRGS
ncbi:hydroxyisourate hydrolase [Pusillimonas sp. CC-YST705]|uniref:5-hydroxyisourate hydrolase n=1 Tax=Mesopusillimonas faecipullorum TaxID=2755040 RepID=A0ABS8CA48_9BURK|nr:hydroxyisourate hydrolase [Mesopusillimonas faecipullorum]MCB5362911.1 hydroxyisourate hydrolase [Mesopusillimonas faecipullorum]